MDNLWCCLHGTKRIDPVHTAQLCEDVPVTKSGSIRPSSSTDLDLDSTEGPLGMKVIASPSDAIVDIVFVHGLIGNRDTTWTHKNETFWPQILAADAPNARIMTFGYDANPFKLLSITSSNNLRDNGRDLAHALSNMRAGIEGRPVIFVAHSLGGLVTEEALLLSEREAGQVDDKLKDILPSTSAIAFMGTPHGGAQLANWATHMAKWINTVKRTNYENVAVLRPDSEVLAMVDGNFQRLLQRKPYDEIKVMCFYETIAMAMVGFVVPKMSAELSQHSNTPIHSSHREMTKFSSRKDHGYQTVLGTLLSWIEDIKRKKTATDARKDSAEESQESGQINSKAQRTSQGRSSQLHMSHSAQTQVIESLNMQGTGNMQAGRDFHYNAATPESKCHHVFRTSEYERHMNRNPQRVKGTCEWFLSNQKFTDWRHNEKSSLLWVSADPGCGKSVLSRFLIEEELRRTGSPSICYFFFKDDNDEQKTATNALCAILHQLFSQRSELLKHAELEYERNRDNLRNLFYALWKILTTAAADSHAGEVICVLDALDECQKSERRILLETLCSFYHELPSNNGAGMMLKFLVTSRRYHDIEIEFNKLIRTLPTIHLAGDGEEEVNKISNEIELVINVEVDSLGLQLELEERLQLSLKRKLCEVQNRTYLWLKLILEVIRERVGNLTEKRLNDIFGTIPSTLDEAYEAILSKSADPKRARKLLHIVCAAVRPLTLKEMNIALHIEDGNKTYEEIDPEPQDQFASILRKICGLFVSVKEERVYLIHLTAKEFLVSKEINAQSTSAATTFGQWKHSLAPKESNLVLARACIWHLQLAVFEAASPFLTGPIPGSRLRGDIEVESYIESHDFLDYSATNWVIHSKEADVESDDKFIKSTLEMCETISQRYITWFSIYWSALYRYQSRPTMFKSLHISSMLGLERVVQLLLAAPSVGVNLRDGTGRTPLLWAARSGHEQVVQLLIATPGVDVDSRDNEGRTPLSWAARCGHEQVVQLLLAIPRVDADSRDNGGWTTLSWAARNGHEQVVQLLLAVPGVDADSRDNCRQTPLLWATIYGHKQVVQLLIATPGVDVNSRDNGGWTPLSWAARCGHEQVVQLLLAVPGVDADSRDNGHQTPLSWAAINGREQVVKLLLAVPVVDIDSRDNKSRTPLSLAKEYLTLGKTQRSLWKRKEREYEEVIRLLESHLGKTETRPLPST